MCELLDCLFCSIFVLLFKYFSLYCNIHKSSHILYVHSYIQRLRFYPESETYDVQDEDDTSKLIRLPWNHVMRLSTGTEGFFEKGARVMAIFPETTSFYRAIVSKQPTWTSGMSSQDGGVGNAHKPRVKEVILKFEDDEDQESGKTPHRRVPSRYVIPVPQQYFYEDEDDVDLAAPNTM